MIGRALPLSLMAMLVGVYVAIVMFAVSHSPGAPSDARTKAPENARLGSGEGERQQGDAAGTGCAASFNDRPATVKFFSLSQGYGLVRFDGDKEAILNLGVIFGSGVSELRPGAAVKVDVAQKSCDANAKRYVTKIRPADAEPETASSPAPSNR